MHIVVSGWIGSTNIGDEFVFAGVRQAITDAFGDVTVTALSINPKATRDMHQVDAVHANHPRAVTQVFRQADLVVFGGGGLIQHETSPFNLPYHLSRVALANATRTPVVGLGLGVSPLTTALSKRLVPLLKTMRHVTVRDDASRDALQHVGVAATVACDTAWHTATTLPPPEPVLAARPKLLLSVRPWNISPKGTTRSRLPVAWSKTRSDVPYAARLSNTIRRLTDAGFDVTGLAMQSDRDAQVFDQLDIDLGVITPTVDTLVSAIAQHDVMVAMRYHAGVAATLARMPSVLIGYSDKVTSLAQMLQHGGRHLPFAPDTFSTFDRHVTDVMQDRDASTDVLAARQHQLSLRARNITALRDAVS